MNTSARSETIHKHASPPLPWSWFELEIQDARLSLRSVPHYWPRAPMRDCNRLRRVRHCSSRRPYPEHLDTHDMALRTLGAGSVPDCCLNPYVLARVSNAIPGHHSVDPGMTMVAQKSMVIRGLTLPTTTSCMVPRTISRLSWDTFKPLTKPWHLRRHFHCRAFRRAGLESSSVL